MEFYRFDSEIQAVEQSMNQLKKDTDELNNQIQNQSYDLDELEKRVNLLLHKTNCNQQISDKSYTDDQNDLILLQNINTELKNLNQKNGIRVQADQTLNLTKIDLLISAAIGGLASVIDFLLVKIPKDSNYLNTFQQDGSKLTQWLRDTQNEKIISWVDNLEEICKVPYDKSVNSDLMHVPGFYPKNHRLLSLAHDPIFGLLFAIIDIFQGTCTTIGTDGVIRVVKVAEGAPLHEVLAAPLIWFGHILSDITTKMGIPIPGWCTLQALQFGSFGDKERTIAELSQYMYLQGYDLRHLLTMSFVPAVISLLTRCYFWLFCKRKTESISISEQEYVKIRNDIKLHKLLFIANSVASVGNVIKIFSYHGNPSAINFPLWLGMIKESIAMTRIAMRKTKNYERAIEDRHEIDDNWDILLKANELYL